MVEEVPQMPVATCPSLQCAYAAEPRVFVDQCFKLHGGEGAMAKYITEQGPMAVAVATGGWDSYDGKSILSAAECGEDVDHVVQVVGLHYDPGTLQDNYWLVRNSWGETWGENGYIKLAVGQNACKIADHAHFTTIQSSASSEEPSSSHICGEEGCGENSPAKAEVVKIDREVHFGEFDDEKLPVSQKADFRIIDRVRPTKEEEKLRFDVQAGLDLDRRHRGFQKSKRVDHCTDVHYGDLNVMPGPIDVDWRHCLTTPIKDQGNCGSCWAFGSAEQIESDLMRQGGPKLHLSPLRMVNNSSCDEPCRTHSSGVFWLSSWSNFAFMVGFFRVSFLTEMSWALSLASRKFRSVPRSASFVFCK